METLWLDLRYSARGLRKKPLGAFIIVLTLALGIGANTAIFSFVNALLLTALPFKDSERLAHVVSLRGNEAGLVSTLEVADFNREAKLFEGFAASRSTQYNIAEGGQAEVVFASMNTYNLFELLGAQPVYGETWPANVDVYRRSPPGDYENRGIRQSAVIAKLKPEIALALVLLVGAGLMVKSFLRLQQTELGFRPDNLLTLRVALPWRKYSDTQGPERERQFYQQLLERLTGLPGVESAAITSNLPLSSERQEGKLTFTVEGQSAEEQQRNPYLNALRASPNYFQTIGVRLIKGRLLNEFDTAETERVGVISQRLAERAWSGQDPIGKRLKVGGVNSQGAWTTVVGVVGDVKHEEIAGHGGLDLYVSYQQFGDSNMYLLLRTKVAPTALADAATRAVWAGDPEQSTSAACFIKSARPTR